MTSFNFCRIKIGDTDTETLLRIRDTMCGIKHDVEDQLILFDFDNLRPIPQDLHKLDNNSKDFCNLSIKRYFIKKAKVDGLSRQDAPAEVYEKVIDPIHDMVTKEIQEWQIKNWGCVSNPVDIVEYGIDELVFTTFGGVPLKIIQFMSEKIPDVTFTLHSTDESINSEICSIHVDSYMNGQVTTTGTDNRIEIVNRFKEYLSNVSENKRSPLISAEDFLNTYFWSTVVSYNKPKDGDKPRTIPLKSKFAIALTKCIEANMIITDKGCATIIGDNGRYETCDCECERRY